MIKQLLARSFFFNLFSEARFSHAKKYLIKSLRQKLIPYETYVLSKEKTHSINIWALKQVKHRVQHVSEDLYIWDFNGESWLANLTHVHGLYEYLSEAFSTLYSCEYQGKSVLDIGGYIGDSARYFLKQGAKKVTIYEPVRKNLLCMEYNLQNVMSYVEIIPKGVSAHDGHTTISSSYPEGHIGFGCPGDAYHITFESESFASILQHTEADIAKIDCEGNEKYLLDVEEELLRKIAYWIVEIHDLQLVAKLHDKFSKAGFNAQRISLSQDYLTVYHYIVN